MIAALIHGFILAIGLIVPLGVQNFFIFNQGAEQPTWRGALPSVLTASICDTILIVLAISGVSLVIFEYTSARTFIYFFGLIFLIYMGWSSWRHTPDPSESKRTALSAKKQIAFAASVSILNPHAIIDSVAVIGTQSMSYTADAKYAFALSCISVSWVWFFWLSWMGHRIQKKGGISWMRSLHKVSALIFWAIALSMGRQLALLLMK